jgi:hypothetical protein
MAVQDEKRYLVVNVIGSVEGAGIAVVESSHATPQEAKRAVGRMPVDRQPEAGVFATPKGQPVPDRHTPFELPLGEYPRFDQQVRSFRRLEEDRSRAEVLACKWTGDDGPPWVGMKVRYTLGRDHQGVAVDREARSLGQMDHPTGEERWLVVERFGEVKTEGKVIAVRNTEEAARVCAAERIQEIRNQARQLASDALERARFSPRLAEIREEYRMKQGQALHQGISL